MPRQGPSDATVLELLRADLPCVCPIRLIVDILRRHFDPLPQVLACKEEVNGRWSDDDLYSGNQLTNVTQLALQLKTFFTHSNE